LFLSGTNFTVQQVKKAYTEQVKVDYTHQTLTILSRKAFK